jgi:hypothetical protein
MRFSVPQFIDVEDKIVGPLTLKQAIYTVGSVGFAVGLYIKAGIFWAIVLGLPVLFLAFLLAFVKIHGQPFIHVLYSATFYMIKNKLYLWKKIPKKDTSANINYVQKQATIKPTSVKVTQSKLKELAWTLDTKDSFKK